MTHEEHRLCLEVHGDTHSQIQLFLILAMFCPARYDVNEIFKGNSQIIPDFKVQRW